MTQIIDYVQEAVEATRHFSQEEDRTRFVVQLPNEEALLPTLGATIGALCGQWERALVVSDTPLAGSWGEHVVVTTHAGLLFQPGLFTHLFVCQASWAYVPVYQQWVETHLHPFGLAVGYTQHYHEQERKG